MYWRAVSTPKRKPEQAAEMSKQAAFTAPILVWTKQAVLGKNISGVQVAQMIRSISSGLMPAFSIAAWAARAASSLVGCSGPAMRRSRMPVRDWIHSSLVSTSFSKSAFVMTRSGA